MDVKELIDLMKREKVLVAKLGSMHVELHPSAFTSETAETAKLADVPVEPIPTDEEFMRWSLPESEWAEPKEQN